MADDTSYTIPQFAALCRENCTTPAQGHDDDSVPCGALRRGDDGEEYFAFCGRHWGPVLGAY